MTFVRCVLLLLIPGAVITQQARAQQDAPQRASALQKPEPPVVAPPPRPVIRAVDVAGLIAKPKSEAGIVSRRYETDRGALLRTYPVALSPSRASRLKKFDLDWLTALEAFDFEKVSPAARDELLTLRTRIEDNAKETDRRAADAVYIQSLIPFAATIFDLENARRRIEPVDPIKTATRLDLLRKQLDRAKREFDGLRQVLPPTKARTALAADATDSLRDALRVWFNFYNGYDPEFSWWVAEPYKQADAALESYAKHLHEEAKTLPDGKVGESKSVVAPLQGATDVPDLAAMLRTPQSEFAPVLDAYSRGRFERDPNRWLLGLKKVKFDDLSRPAQVDYLLLKNSLERDAKRNAIRGNPRPPAPKDSTGIVGRPIGREALLVELQGEMVPYSPEELIAIAREELAWCDAEMLKASRDLGCGDDWKQAVEKVKAKHLRPGEQPKLIRDLSDEAIAFLKANDLVTVPPLAEETWRMVMMSPERQLVSPFFTGGEVISVAFPTNAMSHDAKLQSLRGNNVHFSRATVHHELIPGHHLQQFMNSRNQTQRRAFNTPFWSEGWALYWELVLYEKGFPKTPEDRVGFLTWRKHRCARIIFSLGYHLGEMSPRQCIDLLIDRVGFEPENATAEVRRSFSGGYGPLYQAAYLLGGFQFWDLRRELVKGGKMSDRQYHDAILREHAMPVSMVRAILTNQTLTADGLPPWRFRRG